MRSGWAITVAAVVCAACTVPPPNGQDPDPAPEAPPACALPLQGTAGCKSGVAVVLDGDSLSPRLAWRPSPLDFGYMKPGLSTARELVFTNLARSALTLSEIAPSNPDFAVEATELVVPPAAANANGVHTPGTARLRVIFQPTRLGRLLGSITFKTNLPQQPSGSADVGGFGGGPAIEVTPSPTLDFGKVAFQPGVDFFTMRRLTVRNDGTRPSPGDDAWNLHLGKQAAAPYWEVTAVGGNASADELCVGTWDNGTSSCTGTLPSYDPSKGLVAGLPAALLPIPVRLKPNSPGLKAWKVKIFSNDPAQPTVEISVTAEVKMYPPCNFSFTPAALNFGLTAPPDDRTLEFSLRNLGTATGDVCLLTGLDLALGSNAMFSLPNGPIGSRELAPGETLRVPIRARPSGATPTPVAATGAVEFSINNPAVRLSTVTLGAWIGESCLVIAPRGLDFGTVQTGCNSATRTFSIYNRCPAGVSVTGSEMTLGPEFFPVDTTGVAPSTIIAPNAAPVTLSLKYRPVDQGTDVGAFTLHLLQGGSNVDEVIVLRGNGGATGANTDTFSTDSRKADVLMVIDDSCSMSDKQNKLRANWSSFFQHAIDEKVDWHLGITTTDSARNGALIGDATNPRVLTSSTPDVFNLFQSKVQVGINGGAAERGAATALTAVTPPLTDNENAGLLRPEANLGVVVVMDARDQSPQPVSYYVNALLNVKGAQRPELFSYSAIVPTMPQAPPTGCSYDDHTAGQHPFHQNMVTSLGGLLREICTTDWATTLKDVGERAFHTQGNNGFNLRAIPDASQPMTLKLDGVVVPPTDMNGVTLWSYDALANTVSFSPVSQPPPGKTIQVDYQVACIP